MSAGWAEEVWRAQRLSASSLPHSHPRDPSRAPRKDQPCRARWSGVGESLPPARGQASESVPGSPRRGGVSVGPWVSKGRGREDNRSVGRIGETEGKDKGSD